MLGIAVGASRTVYEGLYPLMNDVALVFAGLVVVVAIMGVAMYEICAFIEKRFTFWATRASEIVT